MSAHEGIHHDVKQLLLHEGILTPASLNHVLREQEKSKGSFLDILLQLGNFDEKKFVRVITRHFGYMPVNLSIFNLEADLIRLIPKAFAEKHLVLAVDRHEHTLTVAFANPLNLKARDEIRAITGLRIKPVVTEVSAIRKCIEKYYGLDEARKKNQAEEGKEEKASIDDLVRMIELEHQDDTMGSASELMKVALETPVVKLVNMLLVEGIKRHASDIFIEPWENYVKVRTRVDGLLEEIVRPQKTLAAAIVSRIKIMSELNIAEHRIPQDGRFKVKVNNREVDMRVSILPTNFGEKVCMRLLDTKSQSHDIAKLGFNEQEQDVIKDSSRKPHGMILVTGPTGSGKTTTLYSVLKYLDAPEVNITTVEDPVEYQLPGINQVHVKEHIGLTFPASLRSILRQDPDVILIGEIRDAETMDIAVKAALTGHLVLSTLHTNDAASSVTRMINMGLEPFLITSTVLMISAQRLVRKLCSKCMRPEKADEIILERLKLTKQKDVVFYHPKGCGECRNTGYRGRSVITEILQMTPDVRALILGGANAGAIKEFARSKGMTTLRDCAVRKALVGETSLEEVFRVTTEDSEKVEDDIPAKEDAA